MTLTFLTHLVNISTTSRRLLIINGRNLLQFLKIQNLFVNLAVPVLSSVNGVFIGYARMCLYKTW